MAVIQFRRPVTTELRRRGQCSPATDAFCVTQQFNDPDFYWSNIDPAKAALGHRATDIGNFRCGYPIVAMAAGRARRVQDNATALGAPNNALGIQIEHGYGIVTAYWHLASWSVADGAQVVAGQEIGKLGNTGLGQVCHTHIEATRNGVRFDPEPLMFGGSIDIGTQEADLEIPKTLVHFIQGVIGVGNNLRTAPSTNATAEAVGPDVARVSVFGIVTGSPYSLGGVQRTDWAMVGTYKGVRYVAAPLVTDLRLTSTGARVLELPAAPSAPTGFTQDEVNDAWAHGRLKGIEEKNAGFDRVAAVVKTERAKT